MAERLNVLLKELKIQTSHRLQLSQALQLAVVLHVIFAIAYFRPGICANVCGDLSLSKLLVFTLS